MADHRTRRLIVRISGLVLLVVLGVVLDRAVRLASIGVAYKAKMFCSGVFVSGRDPQGVLTDLEVDDLAILRHINTSMDRATRSVTATILGIVTRRAVYRDGLGCALALDGRTPDRLSAPADGLGAGARGRTRPASAMNVTTAVDGVERPQLSTVLDRAFEEPNPLHLRRTRAVVIVHKGQIVAERYAAGIGPDTPLIGWSMTKSVINALAGILVKEGRLSTDGPVPMPEWQKPGDPRGRITLDELLRMSSGLRFDENMSDPLADVMQMLLSTADMSTYAATKELDATPGMKWQYSSGTSNIIARIIRNVLADDLEYWAYPRRALFDRLGMTGAVMETDAAGTFVGSSFMYATGRDWARLGMLYLQDGVWAGERILPEGWVEYTRSPSPADPRKHYGAHFWLDVPDEYGGTGGSLPQGALHAVGHEAQFVTIVPAREAVIVRLGLTRYGDAWDHVAFVRDVLAVLGPNGG
jgi:CubicO group peptidase (beta-lactamase class C family)